MEISREEEADASGAVHASSTRSNKEPTSTTTTTSSSSSPAVGIGSSSPLSPLLSPLLSPTPDDADQSFVMFQSTVPNVFDSLNDALHTTIEEKIRTSLPILQQDNDTYSNDSNDSNDDDDGGADKKLHKKLSTIYGKYLDTAETYATREIFTMPRGYSKKKRGRILEQFLEFQLAATKRRHSCASDTDIDADINADTGTDEGVKSDVNATWNINNTNDGKNQDKTKETRHKTMMMMKISLIPTSLEDIPNTKQISKLDDELKALRDQLQKARLNKLSLRTKISSHERVQVSSMDELQEHIRTTKYGNSNSNGTGNGNGNGNGQEEFATLKSSMVQILEEKDEMERLYTEGQELSRTMDDIKKRRDEAKERRKKESGNSNSNNNSDNNSDNDNDNDNEGQYGPELNETVEFGEKWKKAALDAANKRKDRDGDEDDTYTDGDTNGQNGQNGQQQQQQQQQSRPPRKKLTMEEEFQKRWKDNIAKEDVLSSSWGLSTK